MRVHKGLAWASLAALAAAGLPAAAQSAGPLKGAAAWAALLGNTIAGSTADGAYAEFFQPDGTTIHADQDGRESGRWSVKGETVCFSYPADPDEQVECRSVEVDGSKGAFVNLDGSRYAFDILPGDARQLR